jgi:hypothetical protein
MALSQDQREQFLAEPHVAALSVNSGDDRGPRTVPIWYQHTPGGEPWVLTGAASRAEPTVRRQAFLDYAASDLGSQVAIYLQPQHWLSADLGEG